MCPFTFSRHLLIVLLGTGVLVRCAKYISIPRTTEPTRQGRSATSGSNDEAGATDKGELPPATVIGVSVGIITGIGLAVAAWMFYSYQSPRPTCMKEKSCRPDDEVEAKTGFTVGSRVGILTGFIEWLKTKRSSLRDGKAISLVELELGYQHLRHEMDSKKTREEIDGRSIVIHEAPEDVTSAYAELPEEGSQRQ